jgi:hypothetical protein
VADLDAVQIEFKETARPTFIRSAEGRDLACRGVLFVEPAAGRLLTSEVLVRDASGHLDADVKVGFGPWEPEGILVPTQMWEHYDFIPDTHESRENSLGQGPTEVTGRGEYVDGTAEYAKYRRFRVSSTFIP